MISSRALVAQDLERYARHRRILANAEHLNVGLGTEMFRAFASMLFEAPEVTRLQVDPDPGNGRAIRCFENSDFR